MQNSNAQPQRLQWQPQPINQNDQFATYPSPIPVVHNINTEPYNDIANFNRLLKPCWLTNNQFDALISSMADFPNSNASEKHLEAQPQQQSFMQQASMPSLQQDNFTLPLHNRLMLLRSMQGAEINDYSMLAHFIKLQNESDISGFAFDWSAIDLQGLENLAKLVVMYAQTLLSFSLVVD